MDFAGQTVLRGFFVRIGKFLGIFRHIRRSCRWAREETPGELLSSQKELGYNPGAPRRLVGEVLHRQSDPLPSRSPRD
jgi:hypothetical protein